MFDIGFFELVLLGVVGLLVLGPERLPHAIRMTSAYLGKIRRAVSSVRDEFEREVNIQEMQERIKQQMEESGLDEAQKSLHNLKQQVEAPFPIANSKEIGEKLKQQEQEQEEDDPDTRHNPTLPENEAEPLPEPEPEPEAKQESPKA